MRYRWTVPSSPLGLMLACGEDPALADPGTSGYTSTGASASSTDCGSSTSGPAPALDTGSSGSGDAIGGCQATCEESNDCETSGSGGPEWSCERGFCELDDDPMPCDPVSCGFVGLGTCAEVDGFSVCTLPCIFGGNECVARQQECIAQDDAGAFICADAPCRSAAEGEPCLTPCGRSVGTCIDGQCICQVDEECTHPGLVCRR